MVKNERALSSMGMLTFAVFFLMWTYTYVIPRYLPVFASPDIIRELSSFLLTIGMVFLSYRLANGIMHLILVALLAPLFYQFFGHVWYLTPIEEWEQVRLLISLILAVLFSIVLPRYIHATAKFASILCGSFLISASIESLFSTMHYWDGIGTCLTAWDASECTPFYLSWMLSLVVIFCWYLYDSFQRTFSVSRPLSIEEVPYSLMTTDHPSVSNHPI